MSLSCPARQKTKKTLLAGHSSNTIRSREALGCRSPAPGCLGVTSPGLGVMRRLHVKSTCNSLEMCNNQQCQGKAAYSPEVSRKDFGQKQSRAEGTACFRAGTQACPSRRDSLLHSHLGNGAGGSGLSPLGSLGDCWATRRYRSELQSDA